MKCSRPVVVSTPPLQRRILISALAALAVLAVLPAAASARIVINVPGVDPDFRGGVHDYVIASNVCSKRFRISVNTPGGNPADSARIGVSERFIGRGHRFLRLKEGQAIAVSFFRKRGPDGHYFFRCLPEDFPEYTYRRIRKPAVPFFAITNNQLGALDPNFSIVFDSNGTPIWWDQGSTLALDAKLHEGGRVSWQRTYGGGFVTDPTGAVELRRTNGRLIRLLRTQGSPTNHHEFQETPDGNYVLTSYKPRSGVDLTGCKPDNNATVLDGVVQKITPTGQVLWTWNSKDHIALAETGRYCNENIQPGGPGTPYDPVHLNGVEPLANGDYLISFRNLDAVYRVDGITGAIEWKLGGTPTTKSLAVVGDPVAYPLAAQHDPRMLRNGTITIFDNGSQFPGRAPRAVQYRVANGTATFLRQKRDPLVPASPFTGSARLFGKSWIIAWGGTNIVTEFNAQGKRTFLLTLGEDVFTYRANPAGRNITSGRQRGRGMNRQVPLHR